MRVEEMEEASYLYWDDDEEEEEGDDDDDDFHEGFEYYTCILNG